MFVRVEQNERKFHTVEMDYTNNEPAICELCHETIDAEETKRVLGRYMYHKACADKVAHHWWKNDNLKIFSYLDECRSVQSAAEFAGISEHKVILEMIAEADRVGLSDDELSELMTYYDILDGTEFYDDMKELIAAKHATHEHIQYEHQITVIDDVSVDIDIADSECKCENGHTITPGSLRYVLTDADGKKTVLCKDCYYKCTQQN